MSTSPYPPQVPMQECGASTPREELERQIMDSRLPKNEREWWAAGEIERLQKEVADWIGRYNAMGGLVDDQAARANNPVQGAEQPTPATTGGNGGRTVGANPATGATAYARAKAFNVLTHHPDCLRDDVPLQDLIEDIAEAIEQGRKLGMEEVSRVWFTK